ARPSSAGVSTEQPLCDRMEGAVVFRERSNANAAFAQYGWSDIFEVIPKF
ncbi:MAG: hypothetical protein QOI13_1303, partial [Paraburkholderia sp.]|nr:hypothetical protein [Paraburkholderia sp.]